MRTSHRRMPWPRLAALLAAVALLPWAPAGAATQDELEATRERIQETITELESVDARADRTEEEVAAAAARVVELEEALNQLLVQLQAQEAAVAAARGEAEAAAAERDRVETILGDRARRAFMGANADPIMLLSGGGMDDVAGALDDIAMLDALAARADASIEKLDVVRVQADTTAQRLDQEVERLEEVRTAREEVLVEAEQVLEARSEALSELEAQSDRLMAQREELEDDEAEIQELVRQQEAQARREAREAEEARRRRAQQAAEQAAATEAATEAAAQEETQETTDGSAGEARPPASSGECYAWPASGAVTSEYGPRWGRMHRGLDIDGDTGDPLYAAQSGTVTFTRYHSGYGNLTLIRHADGVTTAYAHQSAFGVTEGQSVSRGEYIGRMGATGNVTGSHLHFETRTSSGAVNPRNYLC